MVSTVDPASERDKTGNRADWPARRRFQLNGPVTEPATVYRLAPALCARLVGRSLVTLAVLVAAATVVGLVTGAGWVPAGVVALVGGVLVAGWAWYLRRGSWAVRLTDEGYAVRFLAGVGAPTARWSQVDEVLAASPGGTQCLVIRLHSGELTRLPVAAVAGDPDALARDVRLRVRDAHTPPA